MAEKKIVINIDDKGNIDAETFGMTGASCIDELDKLMKGLAMSTETTKKDEFFNQGVRGSSTVTNKNG